MDLLRFPDASLYELAIESEPNPQLLQISPTTFKSMVGLVLDLLIDQRLPATIWLKLPKGEVWQAEIQQFCQKATAPYSLYSLQTNQDTDDRKQKVEVSEANAWESDTPEPSLEEAIDGNEFPAAENCTVHRLPLSSESQLKREYFLLVAAPGFQGLILTHRPRSSRPKPDSKVSLSDETLEQKHLLLGLCSFEPSTLQRVLEGINRAICFGQPGTKSSEQIASLLLDWKTLTADNLTPMNPSLLGSLLTKQIQRQEDIWRNGAAHRRQAENATSLRQGNEDLLLNLRQKDEFVKIMGQELRTPLSTMKTALSLLNSPSLKPPQRQRYMDMLSQECDRQSSLITSVLDLVQIESMIDPAPMEALRLADIVPGVVSTYQPLAQERGIMLGYMIPEDLQPVSCVSHWLKQIVINLLHNSIKFTSNGGQVWVRAKQQGDYVQIEFRDTGIGIASADLPRIFDRFYRVRIASGEDSSGSGLGLSIVQQLLLRCGGSIAVKSKVNEGSAFTLLLPVYKKEK
ncbi:histidine kinase [Phormidium tenue FACHB-886]|nr:histidine kinase [Phormidium tenue FACHB-886]